MSSQQSTVHSPQQGTAQVSPPSGGRGGERPILFQTQMVKAILEGTKTQTRRVIKDIHPDSILTEYKALGFVWIEPDQFELPDDQKIASVHHYSPYGKPGDLLWVKETFGIKEPTSPDQDWNTFLYKANEYPDHFPPCKWKPSIHMPKEAARIWLMIEDIRVERVQEISEEDAKAEGVKISNSGKAYFNYTPNYERATQFIYDCHSAKESFKTLWDSINSNWRSNPWVWVLKFRVLSTTGKPSDEVIQKNLSELCAFAVKKESEVPNA